MRERSGMFMGLMVGLMWLCLPGLGVGGAMAQGWGAGGGGVVGGGGGVTAEDVGVRLVWSSQEVVVGGVGGGEAKVVLAVVLEVPPPLHINVESGRLPEKLKETLIPTMVRVEAVGGGGGVGGGGVRIGEPQWPEAHEIEVRIAGLPPRLPVLSGTVVVWVPVVVEEGGTVGERVLEVTVKFQACNETACFQPAERKVRTTLRVVGPGPGEKAPQASGVGAGSGEGLFEGFDEAGWETRQEERVEGAAGMVKVEEDVVFDVFGWRFSVDGTTRWGRVGLLLLAGLGGVLLNFTPCVLPMIPLKIMGLSEAAGSPGRCLRLGVAMGVGVVGFWLGLGVVMASVSTALSTSGLFGYWWFPLGVGVLIAAMALGMFGLFSVGLPQWVYRIQPRHDTYGGSVGFGVMAAVLATPCTAPLMASAAAWAVAQTAALTLAVFTAIGVGMALPYVVLAVNPKWVQKMPRSGPGGELIKQAMGLLLLAAAMFFLGTGINGLLANQGVRPGQWFWWPIGGLAAGAGVWVLLRGWPISSQWWQGAVVGIAGVALVAAGAYAAWAFTRPSEIPWVAYTPAAYQEAVERGDVVVLEFTADWCLNCKFLETSVLETRPVIAAMNQAGVVPMKVDLTGDAPEAWAKLAEQGRTAPPLLVVVTGDGRGGARRVFASEAYTKAQVVGAVREAVGG